MARHIDIEIKFIHGWGFDASFWRHWQFPTLDTVKLTGLDRGYFGRIQPLTDFAKDARFKTLIVHSFGLHLAPPTLLAECDLLVAISSFLSIHPTGSALKQSQRLVEGMKEKLISKPVEVLNNFYERCGMVPRNSNHPSDIDVPLLMMDLEHLNEASLDISRLSQIPKVLILHGVQDRIVPASKSSQLNQLLPNSLLYMCDGAEHALPYIQSDWCRYIVQKHIESGVSSESFVEIFS
jgi:hypothetical protein